MTNKTEYVPGELSQAEKRAALENDRRVREQRGSTLHEFAQSEAAEPRGRFGAQERPSVVGSSISPEYYAAPNWSQDPVPAEPPLGYAIGDPPLPVGEPHEIERSIRQLGDAGLLSGPPEGGAVEDPASVFPASSDAAEPAAPLLNKPDDEPPRAD